MTIKRVWQSLWQREDGANLILMALLMTVLLGFVGIAIDGSNVYFQQQRMQVAADAAALGGARKLATDAPHNAVSGEVTTLAVDNGADADLVTWNYINSNRGVRVVAARAVDSYFAHLFGQNSFTVSAEAEAQYEFVTGTGGLMPFTVPCNCGEGEGGVPAEGEEGEGEGGEGGENPTPTSTPIPGSENIPTSSVIEIPGAESSYGISYVNHSGNTWTYEVSELDSGNLDYWLLNVATCLAQVVSATPSAGVGTDTQSALSGIKWDVDETFSSGSFSFTLDDDYPAGEVGVLAHTGTEFGIGAIRGPICDGTNNGGGDGGDGSGSVGLCLSTLDFETDTAGAALVAGQVIDTEWAAWGIRVSSQSPTLYPAMIFNSANPTGSDEDLGTPNQAFSGPGVGIGGGGGMPGSNSVPRGKVLIVSENGSSANPDDNANGGTLFFDFDYAVRIDDVQILDIDDASAAGTVRAYGDASGTTLVATGKMLGLGDNSIQTVAVNALSARRLEITLPKGGAVAAIVSCRTGPQNTYSLGNLIWDDANNNGLQEQGETGIAGVALELYVAGQSFVIATATTNVSGEYLFSGLPAGSYEVMVAASNFGAGKALEGATYAIANQGGDESLDSDFDSATGRAPAIIVSSNNTAVDGGFDLPSSEPVDPGAEEAVVVVNDNQSSQYKVTLVSTVGNTWTYRVTELSGRDLSYWALGIESCVDKIISASPASGFSSGTNVAPSFTGIKWTVDNQFSDSTFSFTLNGAYQSRPRPVLMMSNQSATQTIAGPDCTLPGASPTPTPAGTPAPTATPGGGEGGEGGEGGGGELDCDCSEGAGYEYGVQYILHEPVAFAPGNVGWIRWGGDTPSTTDLEYNINYPAESDIVAIGDWIEGTTGIKNSVLPAIALEQWIGKEIIIPVFDQVTGTGSNAEYRICAFAVFILDDYDRSEKEMTGRFVRTIIRGEESAPDGPDFGARDVRLVK